jgi:hypothetical protein
MVCVLDLPLLSLFFPFAVLGFEFRTYTLTHSTSPFFVMGFFEIGSEELFVWGWL